MTHIDPNKRRDPTFDRMFDDEQPIALPARSPRVILDGQKTIPYDFRIISERNYTRMIAFINRAIDADVVFPKWETVGDARPHPSHNR